jgi:uncharacterized membrane protein YgcG
VYRRTSVAAAAASASLALMAGTGVASAAQVSGVVVDRNGHAHTFVIADQQGRLREVHSRVTPALGRHVAVVVSALHNGTWIAKRLHVGSSARRARVRGTVTYESARRGVFVVSARGVSLLVHGRIHHNRHAADLTTFLATSADQLPPVGSTVTVSTDVSGGEVDATQVADQGQNVNGVDLEGTILAIDTTARTLSISADDSEQSTGSITVQVPASFDLSLFQVGGRVELIASLGPDGTYTLEQSSDDGSVAQAQNRGHDQGDGHGDQHSSAAALCQAQQVDPNFAAAHNGATFDQFYSPDPSNTNDAFGRCVDAAASDHGASTSPEAQCFAQRNDPNFAATHSGESFLQFYSTDPTQLNPEDAFGHCLDVMHQSSDQSQGGGGGQPGSGGSGGSDGTSSGSGS